MGTKLAAYPWRLTAGSFVGAARESAARLQQDPIALGQAHWSTANYQPFQEGAIWEGLVQMQEQGEHVGASSATLGLSGCPRARVSAQHPTHAGRPGCARQRRPTPAAQHGDIPASQAAPTSHLLPPSGVVREIGVSNYGRRQLAKVESFLEKRGTRLASAQVQYSLLSVGTDQQDVKAACDDMGITLIAYSPLALGLLTGAGES